MNVDILEFRLTSMASMHGIEAATVGVNVDSEVLEVQQATGVPVLKRKLRLRKKTRILLLSLQGRMQRKVMNFHLNTVQILQARLPFRLKLCIVCLCCFRHFLEDLQAMSVQ